MKAKLHPDCPDCTRCGFVRVTWSDRDGLVDVSDPEELAELFVSISQDHSYDRHEPDGLPSSLSGALWAVVEQHLAWVRPDDWRGHTADFNVGQRAALKQALLSKLKELRG